MKKKNIVIHCKIKNLKQYTPCFCMHGQTKNLLINNTYYKCEIPKLMSIHFEADIQIINKLNLLQYPITV